MTRLALALLVCLAWLIWLPAPAGAQSAGQTDNRSARALRFDVGLELLADGRLQVRETQEIAFSGGPFQKATRRIPMRHVTRLSDIKVEIDGTAARPGRDTAGTFDVSGPTDGSGDGEVLIEYWFPRTSNARRTFVVDYTASGAVAFYAGGDQLRWNALTQDRPYPIDRSTISLRLPSSVSEWKVDAYPSSLLASEPSASGATAAWQTRALPPNQPLEIRAQWPHGVVAGTAPPWQEAADREAYRRESLRPVLNVAFGAATLLVFVAGGVTLLLTWYARGRDPNIGAVPAELDAPPSDLSPALAGTVVDEHADVQDVLATLLDLAARNVITITEVIDRGLFGSPRDFQLALVDRSKVDDPFEKLLLDSIFRGGDEVRLSRIGDWFGTQVPRLQASLHAEAHRAGLFTADPEVVRRRYQRLGTLVIGVGALLGIATCAIVDGASEVAWWPFIALIAVGAVLRYTARVMPQRTAHGALEAARWRAYARHLHRIGPSASHAEKDGHDDEIERVLPYAVALGADREWVEKLESVGAPAPRWIRNRPPVIVMGGPMGPWGGGYGGGWGGPTGPYGGRRGRGRIPIPASGGPGEPPVVGNDPIDRGSNTLADLLNAASEVLGRGGSGGWSGGGFGGGSFSGGGGGGGGGGSSFS